MRIGLIYFSVITVISALAFLAVTSAHGFDMSQAIGDIVLALTGIVIAVYTYETYKLRKITTESHISQNRPVLSFEGSLSNGGIAGEGLGNILLKNCGTGPAIGVKLSIAVDNMNKDLSVDYDPGVMPIGEITNVGCSSEVYQEALTKSKRKFPIVITAHYEDLAGIQYSTEIHLTSEIEQRPMREDVAKAIVHNRLR